MRRAAPGGVALVLAIFAAAVTLGCGGAQSHPRYALRWRGTPQVFRIRTLASDRVLIGAVRNTSARILHLSATALVVRDADGRALRSSAGFRAGYAHGLFGAFQQPAQLPHEELIRLGKIVDLSPGGSAPLYASWRLGPTSKAPVQIDYGSGTLTVPAARGETAR